MNMQDFYTRQKGSEGKKVPLYSPSGEPTSHWLLVRSIDSDEFRRAEIQAKRAAAKLVEIEDEEERAAEVRKQTTGVIASLIAGWSFEQECSPDNVVNFLTEAPQIADMVNQIAARRRDFYNAPSENCTSGQKRK